MMSKFKKEYLILLMQLFMFYIFPMFAGPTDTIGMVVLIILATFILSLLLGVISKNKLKFFYPIIVALIFIPSIFIYYNTSATIHSIWYLVISTIGLLLGTILKKLIK